MLKNKFQVLSLREVGRRAYQTVNGLASARRASMLSMTFLLIIYARVDGANVDGANVHGGHVVGFDAPAMVVAEPINPAVVEMPTTGGDLFRLRIPVSTFIASEFRGQVSEFVVEIESPHQSLRVIDFWPRSEIYSDIEGTVSVENSQQKDQRFSFNASAAYEPFGRAAAEGEFHNKTNVQESFQRRPPMQVLTSSGTIRRGFGVFFKFRPGPLPVLEGSRELALLVETPPGWRADLLKFSMRAVGVERSGQSKSVELGSLRVWTTIHREGDQVAAAQAARYVSQERALRASAAANEQRVQEKSLPTLWHRLGASLDVVEPKIPGDYLGQIIFSATNEFYDNAATNRLPVDLRVAILDYWDARNSLMGLARGTTFQSPNNYVSLND